MMPARIGRRSAGLVRFWRLHRPLMALALIVAWAGAAEETPPPPPAVGVDTLPPLSLSDAESLTNRAQLLLEGYGGTGVSQDDQRLARLMVQCVIDYAQLRRQRRVPLDQLTSLGRHVLDTPGQEIKFALEANPPVPHVQGIALECSREPVEVHSVTVETEESDPFTLRLGLTLDPTLPGRSFHDLPDLVTVRAITVRAVTQSDRRPRLSVWLVQTPRPEHLSQAITHLHAAREGLDEGDLERAKAELDLARQGLTSAREAETE